MIKSRQKWSSKLLYSRNAVGAPCIRRVCCKLCIIADNSSACELLSRYMHNSRCKIHCLGGDFMKRQVDNRCNGRVEISVKLFHSCVVERKPAQLIWYAAGNSSATQCCSTWKLQVDKLLTRFLINSPERNGKSWPELSARKDDYLLERTCKLFTSTFERHSVSTALVLWKRWRKKFKKKLETKTI